MKKINIVCILYEGGKNRTPHLKQSTNMSLRSQVEEDVNTRQLGLHEAIVKGGFLWSIRGVR
jgi:hypothetical protein